MTINNILSGFDTSVEKITESIRDKEIRVLREEFLLKEDMDLDMYVPGEYYFEVVYGEKPDPSCLKEDFDSDGNYIGKEIKD